MNRRYFFCSLIAWLCFLPAAGLAQTVSFQSSPVDLVNYRPLFVAVADVNGDGKLDLIVGQEFSDQQTRNTDPTLDRVAIRLGNGGATFGAPLLLNCGPRPSSGAGGEFNGVGKRGL